MITSFFGESHFVDHYLNNTQVFDFQALIGRALSSSYMPTPDHRNYRLLLNDLEQLFRSHGDKGCITFRYDTIIFIGQLKD